MIYKLLLIVLILFILNISYRAISFKYCIICDIDNVYSDSREWNKYLPVASDRKSWDLYFEKHYLVKPNKYIINKIIKLSKIFPIIFITAREDIYNNRLDTINEIERFSNNKIIIGSTHKLYMREANDYRKSYIVKDDILNKYIFNSYKPILSIDDEENNVEMFKRYGIKTVLYKIGE